MEQDENIDWRKVYAQWNVSDLIRAALVEQTEEETDSSTYCPAISTLQARGNQEVLEQMIQLLASPHSRERCLGARILAQMKEDEYPAYHAFQDEAVMALLDALACEDDPEVLDGICTALGHRGDPRAVEQLVALKDHPDARVRFGVTFGLHSFTDPVSIATLLTLTTDSDDHVRDWATFTFNLLEVDTPEIREALFARVNDVNRDIRSEAIEGLALRQDPRAVPALLAALHDGANGSPIYEAATALADARLYPALIALRENWTGYDYNLDNLDAAIIACDPATPREEKLPNTTEDEDLPE